VRDNLRACLIAKELTGISLEELECEYSEQAIYNIINAGSQNNGKGLSERQKALDAGFTDEERDGDVQKAIKKLGLHG
jgi:hypothetical protein